MNESLPYAGLMTGGEVYELPQWSKRIINLRGKGSWPTPTAQSAEQGPGRHGREGGPNLVTAVNESLRGEVFPTPTTQDAKNNAGPAQRRRNSDPLNVVAGGPLNPKWVEWLMGFPLDFTQVKGGSSA